jgi:hypothetical protein
MRILIGEILEGEQQRLSNLAKLGREAKRSSTKECVNGQANSLVVGEHVLQNVH